MTVNFPKEFIWGAATAAYQVEGAIHEDGRTASIWDTYCAVPGNIADGSSGAVACDQYHRIDQDIAIMKELGIGAYRFSIAWPRIIPQFQGSVNQKGIDYYSLLVDKLRSAGIKPVATLYHWDLPQYLQDRGGWAWRDTAEYFAQYAAIMAGALGDRVDTWTTLNEPWCSAYLGYGNGAHAPGIRDYNQALRAAHHLNLAHGLAVAAIRSELGAQAICSVTLNLQVNRAASDSEQDMQAKHLADLFGNEVFLGPMLEGKYDPAIMDASAYITDWSFVQDGDEQLIHQPIDVLGINYYSTNTVRWVNSDNNTAHERDRHAGAMPAQECVETLPPTGELTAMGWNQDPQGLTDIVMKIAHRYPRLDLMITENGSAFDDVVSKDTGIAAVVNEQDSESLPAIQGGMIVHDPQRVHYLQQHLHALAHAIEQGARVTGYFAWSLLDNFEWALGYTKRFGIIRVDYHTQQRIWKDSARYYQAVIATGALE